MAKLHPAKLGASMLALAFVALLAMACSGGDEEAVTRPPTWRCRPGYP